MHGTLHGLGLGPGDPELITLKSWRILSMAEVIAWPRGPSGESRARATAAPFIPDDVVEMAVPIPFGETQEALDAAYDAAAEDIRAHLAAGRDVAFICMGDPLFHGSFIYLAERLRGDFPVKAVPGVMAPSACAAAIGRPLACKQGVFKVLPATMAQKALGAELSAGGGTIAIIKAGHHLRALRGLLDEAGLLDRAYAVENAGREDERIAPLRDCGDDAPYFSTVMVFGEAA